VGRFRRAPKAAIRSRVSEAASIQAHRIVGCSLLHQVLVSALGAAIPVVMPELARSAGLFAGLPGLYALAMYAGAVAATLAGERLFARLGPARSSALAVVFAAAGLLAVLPLDLAAFVIAGLAIGLGYGPVSPASAHMMAGIVGRRDLNLIFSIRQAGAPLGVLVAGLALPPMVLWLGWRAALLAFALAAVGLALATLGFARRVDRMLGPRAAPGNWFGPARAALAAPAIRALVATSFLFSAMLATLNAFVPTVVSVLGGLDLAAAGLCAVAAQSGAIGGRLVWGVVADRLLAPRRTLATIGGLMAAVTLALGTIDAATGFATILALSAALGATAGGWGGVTLAQAARLAPPGAVGRITSGVMVFNYLGVLLGPPVVGVVLALTGSFFTALACVAAVGGVGGMLALRMPAPPDRAQPHA
jgi:MFS family permease